MAALDAGYATTASGVTLDRFCGSGITASNFAATSIMAGMEDVVIAGGAEMMSSYKANTAGLSRSPFMDGATSTCAPSTRRRTRAWPPTPSPPSRASPWTALGRAAAESQRRRRAWRSRKGRFDRSLVPVLEEDGTVALDRERVPATGHHRRVARPRCRRRSRSSRTIALDEDGNTYRQQVLRRYPGLEINHVHHAGNSSGVVDGAAAIL